MASKQPTYQYTRLTDLKPGIHHVYGVVKFCKVPAMTQGTDYIQVLSVTDDSLESYEKLVISLFYKTVDAFPSLTIGDVIRFHRLQVESVRDELKGRPHFGFSWLFVHDDLDSPCASSKSFTYAEQDRQRVLELQTWAKRQSFLQEQPHLCTLSSLVPRQYADLVCQVVATHLEEKDTCFVARVWDGTRCAHPMARFAKEMDNVDHALEERAAALTVDAFIYDNHVPSCRSMQPGQFIKLCNIHAALHKSDADTTDQQTVSATKLELVLHHGTAFGRGVVLLSPTSPQAVAVKQRIESFVPDNSYSDNSTLYPSSSKSDSNKIQTSGATSENSMDISERDSTSVSSVNRKAATSQEHFGDGDVIILSSSEEDSFTREASKRLEARRRKDPSGGKTDGGPSSRRRLHNESESVPSLQSSVETCMLRTATVINGHQHISRTPLQEVFTHTIPGKFRVLAHLVDFHPNACDPAQFLQQLCPKCFSLTKPSSNPPPSDNQVEPNVLEEQQSSQSTDAPSKAGNLIGSFGGGLANWNPEITEPGPKRPVCTQCSGDGESVSLELIFLLRLVLEDSKGNCLVANLWRDEAITFFRGVKPEDILADEGLCQELMQTLNSLRLPPTPCPSGSAPPKLDCCLMSYNTKNGPNFQIFDTVLI